MFEDVEDSRSLLDSLISKVSENLGKEFKDARYELVTPDEAFFVSSLFFVNVTANSSNDGRKEKTVRLVVKRPPLIKHTRDVTNSDSQFHNEILFYQRVAKDHEDLPRCFYAVEKAPIDSVIVLENISQRGYGLCRWRYRVPMEYTVTAMQEIARFHAKGYVMKERRRDEFFDVVWDLWEVRFNLDPENLLKVMIDSSMSRGVKYLRAQGYDKYFCDKVCAEFEKAYQTVALPAVEPEEPLATLCHGDFTLNNVFFKKEDDGMRAMLIDFALARYGSPVIDLSGFLCLHCAEELDKDLLEKLLKVYHDSLRQCLEENGIEDCEKYSYEALYDEYKRKGLFGYCIASFFLALSMDKAEISTEEVMAIDMKDWPQIGPLMGGDEISEILANLLLRLKEIGCLDHLI